jgi:hypothetical protein
MIYEFKIMTDVFNGSTTKDGHKVAKNSTFMEIIIMKNKKTTLIALMMLITLLFTSYAHADAFDDFKLTITNAGGNPITITLEEIIDVDENYTIPENVHIVIRNTGGFDVYETYYLDFKL